MTQIYQHKADENRGDKTISMYFGIKGTFVFAFSFFVLAIAGFFLYFLTWYNKLYAILFIFFLIPTMIYFIFWFIKVFRK